MACGGSTWRSSTTADFPGRVGTRAPSARDRGRWRVVVGRASLATGGALRLMIIQQGGR
jgi:hypothetical protein